MTTQSTERDPDAGSNAAMLRVRPADRRAIRHPWSRLIRTKYAESRASISGKGFEGQGLIKSSPEQVRKGFAALAGSGFDAYNYPQVWVERRQIPSALHCRVPAENATVIDLGCGPGTSTEVLCHFATPSWKIYGFDLTEAFIEKARARASLNHYRTASGETITPHFECQSIASTLTADGTRLETGSADFAMSGGVVGLYLTEAEAIRLFRELRRVLKPNAYAAIDAGPAIPTGRITRLATAEGFKRVGLAKSFIIEPRPKVILQSVGEGLGD